MKIYVFKISVNRNRKKLTVSRKSNHLIETKKTLGGRLFRYVAYRLWDMPPSTIRALLSFEIFDL